MDFITLRERCIANGYVFWADKHKYNVFVYGVRDTNIGDGFKDKIGVAFIDGKQNQIVIESPATTEPGGGWLGGKMGNPQGTAILCPGQYRSCWAIGVHGKHKQPALVQTKEARFLVWRDPDKDGRIDRTGKLYGDVTALNCHTVYETHDGTKEVGKWSAGCQVFNSVSDHKLFMAVCAISAKKYGNISYTLFDAN